MNHDRPILALPLTLVLAAAGPAQEAETAAPPSRAETVALVRPSGIYADLPEQSIDLMAAMLGGGAKPKSFYEFIERLDELAAGDRGRVLFDLSRPFTFNLAQLAEVDRALGRLRAAGKETFAYLENASSTHLQLAAGCGHVMQADLGVVDAASLALSVTFMKDAFDLLGVQFDVVRCGDFKGAVEPYVLSSMSAHLREHYRAMLERMNAAVARRIAAGRELTFEAVREVQGRRVLTAKDALAAGLTDRLVPWAGPEAALRAALGNDDIEFADVLGRRGERKQINPLLLLSQILNPSAGRDELDEDTIAVLHLTGQIADGHKDAPGSIVSGPTVAEIRKLRDDDDVKAVVARINSPGGSATASEAILLALRDLADRKPVAISMGTLAASGGYYITCIGRPIFAEAGTITGSIGVFGMKPNVGPLMRRIGLHDELVALDDSASMSALDHPWSEPQKARVQVIINDIYDVFVGHVARSRGMTTEDVLAIAGGRVWSGEQAVDRGLVDRIGGLQDAVALVAKEAGIEDYGVIHRPRPRSLFELMAADMFDVRTVLGEVGELALQRVELHRALGLLRDALRSEQPVVIQALMPDVVRLR